MVNRLVLVAGTTETARISGISAAGANPELMTRTPTLDVELVVAGRPQTADSLPVSPTGCVTPAVVTRAVRELVGFDLTVVDAGLSVEPSIETVSLDTSPGKDIREPDPVPGANDIIQRARNLGRSIGEENDRLMIGESIPGGTTTALGVLRALGIDGNVSSSLAENPVAKKQRVVEQGLSASGLEKGSLEGQPVQALRTMGDPVLTGIVGLVSGYLESGQSLTLAGGTQMMTAVALLRQMGIEQPIDLATTVFVNRDPSINLESMADQFNVTVTVSDPRFDQTDHPALLRYEAGEAKEGVAMGGSLQWAEDGGIKNADLHKKIVSILKLGVT